MCASAASACVWESPERWHIFEFDAPSFGAKFRADNDDYWKAYQKSDKEYWWFSFDDLKKAASKRGDSRMLRYLNALQEYDEISSSISGDSWEYPTRQQLNERNQAIRKLLALSKRQAEMGGKLSDRWLLLAMRANMLLGNYADNIWLWTTAAAKAPSGYVKDMMRNVYANALLHSGKNVEAWNIYADQNDDESLVWSARKYTNLAGIKSLYEKYPDAPVFKFLLSKYINTLQDVVDIYYDNLHSEQQSAEDLAWELSNYWEDIVGKAYAPISDDYKTEINDFIAFADSVSHSPATASPAMWESAAALCSYYIGDYAKAKSQITDAMAMPGTQEVKDLARRVRMLVLTETEDLNSADFKRLMAGELSWLGQEMKSSKSYVAGHALDRVLNLGLARNYERLGDKATATLLTIARKCVGIDYSTPSQIIIGELYPLSSDEMKVIFAMLDNPGGDAMIEYAAANIPLSADLRNDILGTKLLQEGRWEDALAYLEQVSTDFLNNQEISFYAARRDYNVPAWNGFQVVGDNNYEAYSKPRHLKRNAKVDFCKEMIALEKQARLASTSALDDILMRQAAALYQASRFGQCWYLSQYGYSAFEEGLIADNELAGAARKLLLQCAQSADSKTRAKALFALAFIAPDSWQTSDYDWDSGRLVTHIHRDSEQYDYYNRLNTLLRSQPAAALPEISRCDVLRQFRRYI